MSVSTLVAPLSPPMPKPNMATLGNLGNLDLSLDLIALDISDPLPKSHPSDKLIHVETTRYGGRGYFASVDIPKDSSVLSAPSPFASTIFRQYKKDACAYCFKSDFHRACKVKINAPTISPLLPDLLANKKLKQARSSKQAFAGLFFCSDECRDNWVTLEDPFGAMGLILNLIDQAVASSKAQQEPTTLAKSHVDINQAYIDQYWAEHAAPIPTKKNPTIPCIDTAEHDNARIVAAVVVKSYLIASIPDHVQHYSDEFKTFDDLQSNELQLISAFPDLIASHVNVYRFLTAALNRTPFASHLSVDLFRRVLGKEAGNAFGIWQYPVFLESECVGSSIYPAPSYFNHACEHNVKKVRAGRAMNFVTSRDIQKGEELYISYGMFEDCDVQERQSTLLQQWHFKCACPKCDRQLKEL